MQTTYNGPELVQDAAFSLDAFHRRGSLRRAVEAQIDQLIAFLDYIDGDPDLEPVADDEPSLGFQAGDIFVGRGCEHRESGDDREVEDEHDEPSLGWTRTGALGDGNDLEIEEVSA